MKAMLVKAMALLCALRVRESELVEQVRWCVETKRRKVVAIRES